MRNHCKTPRSRPGRNTGFTVLEILFGMAILLILSSFAVPQFLNMRRAARLRGAVSDFASLVQVQRIRAVDDDRYYSTLIANGAGVNQAFVDIYPQRNNGTSGNQAFTCLQNGCDPEVLIATEVVRQPAAAAPATGALQAQVLPPNSPVVMQDGSAPGTPITFGPRGLPCTPTAVVGGTVCDSLGGATAYWVFFQDAVSQNWAAVTVTPAGRIRRWIFNNAAANGGWRAY